MSYQRPSDERNLAGQPIADGEIFQAHVPVVDDMPAHVTQEPELGEEFGPTDDLPAYIRARDAERVDTGSEGVAPQQVDESAPAQESSKASRRAFNLGVVAVNTVLIGGGQLAAAAWRGMPKNQLLELSPIAGGIGFVAAAAINITANRQANRSRRRN